MIAFYDIDRIDYHVISQILDGHIDRPSYEIINDISMLSESHALCICKQPITVENVSLLILDDHRRRIGQVMDKIESIIFENKYDNISYANVTLQWQDSILKVRNKNYSLTERERQLVAEILSGGERGQSRNYLLNKIWGYRPDLDTHTLETHIYRLRQKIEKTPDHPQLLITIDGGYKFKD